MKFLQRPEGVHEHVELLLDVLLPLGPVPRAPQLGGAQHADELPPDGVELVLPRAPPAPLGGARAEPGLGGDLAALAGVGRLRPLPAAGSIWGILRHPSSWDLLIETCLLSTRTLLFVILL